ncbi:MAG: bifunctional oligoribonuclease/PAP phosphatase NrnA [Halobacteriales archaeon]|nr:bifunctional oligoribonuclease/PAP phosphatase NrnA [Halobacteriales archaeon]
MSSGDTTSRAAELVSLMNNADSVAIVCHDNPDPDCIASALAMRTIADNASVEDVDILYGGEVSHQQNRAFVNLLGVSMSRYRDADLERYDVIGFVDHSQKGENNPVPEDASIDFVVDHHPPDNGVDAVFVDVREEFGATTTILVEYLRELGITPETETATALLFAIRAETLEYLRGTTPMEYEASRYLHELADIDLLDRMTNPAFTPETLDTIGHAILGREVRASSLVSGVGVITERDALPQAADYLMHLEGVSTVLVFGVVDDQIDISARSKDSRVDLNQVMRDAFGDVGSAGGHREMAGAQVPLGVFSDMAEADDKMIELVSGTVKKRFFDAMNLQEDEETEE